MGISTINHSEIGVSYAPTERDESLTGAPPCSGFVVNGNPLD